jgi:hypothetical protein
MAAFEAVADDKVSTADGGFVPSDRDIPLTGRYLSDSEDRKIGSNVCSCSSLATEGDRLPGGLKLGEGFEIGTLIIREIDELQTCPYTSGCSGHGVSEPPSKVNRQKDA